jgi:ABC-type amino acid transport substrate-binding protein
VDPIHRTVSGLDPGFDAVAAFGGWFDLVRAGPTNERTLGALADTPSMALVTADSSYMLFPKPESYEAAGSELDSSLVELVLADVGHHELTYRNSRDEALRAVTAGDADLAVLLRPVTVDQIAEWAGERRKMPPKTSYFSPKPRTGMVFRSLED